jgi:hypothetical protein
MSAMLIRAPSWPRAAGDAAGDAAGALDGDVEAGRLSLPSARGPPP